MSDCLFCKIVVGDLPANKIYEDEAVLAFLDIHPINPGHTLVIPKEHAENFLASSDEAARRVLTVIKKITPAILRAVGSDSFNLGVNSGRAAGQIIFHTHFHIMPRRPGDGFELWRRADDSYEDLAVVAEKIKIELSV